MRVRAIGGCSGGRRPFALCVLLWLGFSTNAQPSGVPRRDLRPAPGGLPPLAQEPPLSVLTLPQMLVCLFPFLSDPATSESETAIRAGALNLLWEFSMLGATGLRNSEAFFRAVGARIATATLEDIDARCDEPERAAG